MVKRICVKCGKEFFTYNSEIRRNGGKFCSRKCYYLSEIGRPGPWRGKKIPKWLVNKRIKSGSEHWAYGKKYSKEHRENLSKSHIGKRKGFFNNKWNGGIKISNGYRYFLNPIHPFATKDGYVMEHRLVMEKYIGRYLKPTEVVHHINKDTSNNVLNNLMLFANSSSHLAYHRFIKTN